MGRLSDYINGAGVGRRGTSMSSVDGIRIEVNDALIDRHRRAMARLLASDPETRKRLKAVIREELKKVRKNLTQDERNAMKDDPRKAYLAVRYSVYKKVLGGNTSILSQKKAGVRGILVKERTLQPGQRGGNRQKVNTENTAFRLSTYLGRDRGFILRFMNSGTRVRGIEFETKENRKYDKWNHHPNTGFRGQIARRGTFETNATRYMDSAAHIIADAFAEEFETAYNEEMKQ